MKDCDRLLPIMFKVVEGEADPDEALDVGRHVTDCTVCRIRLARQRRIAQMVDEMGEPIEVDESFLSQVMASLPDGPPPRIDAGAGRRPVACPGVKPA
jgi:anti-sigma factor RsiW